MTRDEILNMPAGREMDRIIAEKVMGKKTRISDGKWDYVTRFDFADKGELMFAEDNGMSERVPYYSFDIAASWQVAEKTKGIGKQGFDLCTSVSGWMANFGGMAVAHGETPSLAICRAALLIVTDSNP